MSVPDSPALSIVAAAVNPAVTLDAWLRAIAPQVEGRNVDVLIVGVEGDRAIEAARRTHPFGQYVAVPAGVLVPLMWSAGLQRARGSLIAFTITACTPEPGWIDAILAAHASPHAGIGGVIEYAADGTLVDRALHLVRYTPYLPPLPAGPVLDVAGDNGTYKRSALDPFMAALVRDGFWEAEVNRGLRARGETLWIEPRIRVSHAKSYSAAAFSRQRFVHGRVFGRARRGAFSLPSRLAHAALAPIVPLLMLARALRTVAARGRLDTRTVLASPLALWFLTCWAAGEAAGLLGG